MKYRLEDLEAFLHVAEAGRVSQAAVRLGLAKSIVSKRIARLEDVLAVELMHRSTRGVTLTDKGVEFYKRARIILDELEAAGEEMSERGDDLRGSLRVTVPMTFGTLYLSRILFAYLRDHPRLNAQIEFDDRMLDLADAGYDLAVRITRLPGLSLKARKLARSQRIVCCSPEYARRAGRPATLDDLVRHACIGYANVDAGQIWEFKPEKDGMDPHRLTIRSDMIVNNGEAMRDAAIAGLGLAVLPLFIAADALRRGELINALPQPEPTADIIYAVYPFTRHVTRKVRSVIDYLAAELRDPPLWERDLPPFLAEQG